MEMSRDAGSLSVAAAEPVTEGIELTAWRRPE